VTYDDETDEYLPGEAVRKRNRKGRNRRKGVYMMRLMRSWSAR